MSYGEELDWIMAARWSGTPWPMFRTMSGEEQSKIVAAYRVEMQIEAVLAHVKRPRSRPRGRS